MIKIKRSTFIKASCPIVVSQSLLLWYVFAIYQELTHLGLYYSLLVSSSFIVIIGTLSEYFHLGGEYSKLIAFAELVLVLLVVLSKPISGLYGTLAWVAINAGAVILNLVLLLMQERKVR